MRNLSWNTEKPSSRLAVFWKIQLKSLFLNKVVDWRTATLLRRDSSTGDFPWILRNSQEYLFYIKPPEDCFWKWPSRTFGILEKFFANCIFFNQTQSLYNLSRCITHSILAKFLWKVPQKVIASQCDCYLAGFLIFFKWGLEEDEINVSFSIDTESLTVCFIGHSQADIKMKMLNFNLGTVFIFYIAATSRSRCSLVFCIKVVLRLDLVHSKYTGSGERIPRWIKSPLLNQLSRNVALWKLFSLTWVVLKIFGKRTGKIPQTLLEPLALKENLCTSDQLLLYFPVLPSVSRNNFCDKCVWKCRKKIWNFP